MVVHLVERTAAPMVVLMVGKMVDLKVGNLVATTAGH